VISHERKYDEKEEKEEKEEIREIRNTIGKLKI
jgi:hypothetical protein